MYLGSSDRPNEVDGFRVATYPSNAPWLPSTHKPFAVALLPRPLQVTSMGTVEQHTPGSDTRSARFEACGTYLPCRDDSVGSKSYMRVAGAGQKTLIILRSQSSCLALPIPIRKAQMTSLGSP